MNAPSQPYRNRSEMVAAGLSLEDQLDALNTKSALIKSEIQSAQQRTRETGDYSDSEWYQRASLALRLTGIDIQKVQREIGERNRAEKRGRANNFENAFRSAVRKRVSEAVFKECWDEAHEVTRGHDD